MTDHIGNAYSSWAMPSARATHASHRANLRCLGLSVGIAIALGACTSQPPLEYQQEQEGKRPYALIVDDHGCKWRLWLGKGTWPEHAIQRRADGSADCSASGTPTQRAETIGSVGEADGGPTREAGDAQ